MKGCRKDMMKEKKIENKVFLDGLPRKKNINWVKSAEMKAIVHFIYDDIEGDIQIVDYGRNRKYCLTVKYNNKEFDIDRCHFIECKLGRILGKITSDFKFEIGKTFKDENRDLTIIDRKIKKDKKGQNWKCYKYHCNKCNFDGGRHWSIRNKEFRDELWLEESSLLNGKGCSCCEGNQTVVEGINDIGTTNSELIKYFKHPEEAKMYKKSSNRKVLCVCPDCRREKNIAVYSLYNQGLGCSCGDGKSYSEKFMMSVLEQSGIGFEMEYSPDWCKYELNSKLKQGRYDFYIPSINLIIEMDGQFHNSDNDRNGQTKEESQFVDNEKDILALESRIEVIRIDCNYKDISRRFEHIKNSIINSKLNNLFDLSTIDWIKVGQDSEKNLVKEVCEIKRNNSDLSTSEIGETIGLDRTTVRKYLKQGDELGWCKYNAKEEMRKNYIKTKEITRERRSKPIKIIKDGIELGKYPSISELEKCSEKDFGVKLSNGNICMVCKGKRKHHKGFTFRYA